MPSYRGGRVTPDRGLGDQEVNQLLSEHQRELRPAPGNGIGSSLIDNMNHVFLLPEIMDPANIRESFVGQIATEGPDGEEDHEGALYWVRETNNTTPEGTDIHGRPSFMLRDDALVGVYGKDFEESVGVNAPKWVTAVNLAEFNQDNPGMESHAMGFGPRRLVHVFMQISDDGLSRWYFDRAAGGTQLGVVRSIPNDNLPTVGVQAVQKNQETGEREFVGEVVEIACWAGLFGRHYRRHRWPVKPEGEPDPVFPEVKILAVTFVDGEWQAEQTMRYNFPTPPPDAEEPPIGDCNVVRPV